jgi:hypothetical protein
MWFVQNTVYGDKKMKTKLPILYTSLVMSVASVACAPQSGGVQPTAAEIDAQAKKQQSWNVPLSLAATVPTQVMCAGPVPAGWIKVGDAWNPTVCGNPTTIIYNVWTIAHYAVLAIGATLQACAGPAPSGWVIVGTSWNPTACGNPSSIQNNIMVIKRLN